MNENEKFSPEEVAYKEAFNKALDDMLESTPNSSSANSETANKDSSSNEKEPATNDDFRMSASEWDDKDAAQRQAAYEEQTKEEQVTAPRRRGRPRKDEANEDSRSEYERLYNDYKQNAEAQLGLYRSRVNQLAQELRELKSKQEQHKTEPAPLPDEVKEVFEMYPDIGRAVSAYVQNQLSNTKQSLVHDVEQQIQPIKSHLVLSDVQKHQMAIEAAHPDLKNILQSGDLLRWIDSLPPVMKAGAQQVYQYGDSAAVISLLDDYKTSRGITNGRRKTSGRNSGQYQGSELREASSQQGSQEGQELYGNSGSSSVRTGRNGSGAGSLYGDAYGGSNEYSEGNNQFEGKDDEGVDEYADDPLVQRVMAALAVKSNKTPVNPNSAPRKHTKTAEDIFKEVAMDFESNHRRR